MTCEKATQPVQSNPRSSAMKTKLISAVTVLGAALAPQLANAADGTITFTGNITSQTCTSTDAGAALTFGSPGTLTAYSKATGGSYSIPLKAAYYQTQSGAVTPGKANAALIVTMTYE